MGRYPWLLFFLARLLAYARMRWMDDVTRYCWLPQKGSASVSPDHNTFAGISTGTDWICLVCSNFVAAAAVIVVVVRGFSPVLMQS